MSCAEGSWLDADDLIRSMMAEVMSGSNLTTIVLNDYEANALADLLDRFTSVSSSGNAPCPHCLDALKELTNSMLTEKLAFAYDHAIEKGNNNEPF